MQKRPFGQTGEDLSIIGFGGILVTNTEQAEANRLAKYAFDQGINYYDVAPAYGNAEERLGPAIRDFRQDIFLACKTGKRTKAETIDELHRSLQRLETDYFDLYQLHAITSKDDLDQVLAVGGAIEGLIEARQQGLVRYLGFSAHSVEAAVDLIGQFDFDSVLFPVNWVNYFEGNFGPQVMQKAQDKGVARLALKGMAKRKWAEGEDKSSFSKCWYAPVTTEEEAQLALRFTLSQPITAALPPGEASLFDWALKIGRDFSPMTEEEINQLKQRSAGLTPIFQHVA